MHYKFPIINDISEVRAAIKGRPEFIECQKHDYIVFNYVVAGPDTFPKVEGWKNAMLRECRGLIFDLNGKCIRRAYHKFFNLNEREETSINIDNIVDQAYILEKLDGSMICFFKVNEKQIWGTKMGLTDISYEVEKFVNNSQIDYTEFVNKFFDLGYSCIFEWISPKNRIVINYEQENLILTAIRNMKTGEYLNIHNFNFNNV